MIFIKSNNLLSFQKNVSEYCLVVNNWTDYSLGLIGPCQSSFLFSLGNYPPNMEFKAHRFKDNVW